MGFIDNNKKGKDKSLQPRGSLFFNLRALHRNFQELLTNFSNPIFTICCYHWDMDVEPEIQREPKVFTRVWVVISIALWTILALGSFMRSMMISRADSYNPYFAEEGNSENLPSLKH